MYPDLSGSGDRRLAPWTGERYRRDETAPLGIADILAHSPHAAPNKVNRAPAPPVPGSSRKTRKEFYSM